MGVTRILHNYTLISHHGKRVLENPIRVVNEIITK
jgi:hypothetical protein